MSRDLAEVIFPEITKTVADYEEEYPRRIDVQGKPQCCVRFAPSPTGFLHIGAIYTALINRLFADQNNGVFILRIEDTDQKRSITGTVEEIVSAFDLFNIKIDEGAISSDSCMGEYGPYFQSKRKHIYEAFAKELLRRGDAYPCFCSSEDLEQLRQRQMNEKSPVIGYAEADAACRHLTSEEQLARIERGDEYIIRLRSRGSHDQTRVFTDGLRGELEMPVNNQDIVIIKADGLPTYHFAHSVDDHLMRTSHVIRADEWVSSLPIHVELFEIQGFELPEFIHLSPIMKQEGNSRRKLSKRLDPEARASYYIEVGYPLPAVKDYLMNIANSNFEDWRRDNPDVPVESFPFDIYKTSISGALFDFDKLENIAKKIVGNMTEDEIITAYSEWLQTDLDTDENRNSRESMRQWLAEHTKDFGRSISIWHEGRLDVAKWSDVYENYPYLYDRSFSERMPVFPEDFIEQKTDVIAILETYLESYDHSDDNSAWFGKVREIATKFNYAAKPKDYKKNPDLYKGSIVHVSSYVRFAVTHALNTPDLHSMIQFMGEEEMRQRVEATISALRDL
ncbi:MAG: glutamate--tRNA ligase [Eubacteriales bacterium]|nr:glutamate--tRNA ligase [Eubacteriales bacterium]